MIDRSRRKFIKDISGAGFALGISYYADLVSTAKKRIGIIGLDTSHSIEFTKLLNDPLAGTAYKGFKIVAAYPYGSRDIESASSRIPAYTEEVKKMGVDIADSIPDLLKKTDVILLETNDGRLHLEQALQVIKAGKPLFIDKPMAASLKDAMAIYEAAEEHKVPVFSSSALRFMEDVQSIVNGKIGKITGADVFSPAYIEKTHPDLFWYGIHGIETLFTLMGTGCKNVTRIHTEDTDIAVGVWADGRMGVFRGIRSGQKDFGGTAFGEKGISPFGKFTGYQPLLSQITSFFESGIAPVNKDETLEIIAFMEAADESKLTGKAVSLEEVFRKAKEKN